MVSTPGNSEFRRKDKEYISYYIYEARYKVIYVRVT